MFNFKTKPFDHQLEVLKRSAITEAFALFMDMGTGKSKVIIDTANHLYEQGLIDAVVVCAPNGVHRNWVINEIPTHTPDHIEWVAAYYNAGAGKKEQQAWDKTFATPGLKWFCFNIESGSNKKGQDALSMCVKGARVLFVIDESQRIKSPGAKRTKFIVGLARHAAYRRILTGTPITQSPLDFYAQLKFLDPTICGFGTYTAFKSHHAIIEQRKTNSNRRGSYDHIVGYRNIAELEQRVAPHCYRVKKTDCLDLPDKLYEKVYVQLTPEQKRIYNQLVKDSVAVLKEEFSENIPPELRHLSDEDLLLWFAESKLTTKNAMIKLLRLQQVVGGSVPDDDGNVTEVASNRLKTLLELVEDINGKVIIWARFRYDIQSIITSLTEAYGPEAVVAFYGDVSNADRMEAVQRFQSDPECRFFIGQQHSAGTGLTLTAATNAVYYSNDFSLEARLQSEDRCHRIGQYNKVTYFDMVAEGTVDEKILTALATKKTMAEGFNYGD